MISPFLFFLFFCRCTHAHTHGRLSLQVPPASIQCLGCSARWFFLRRDMNGSAVAMVTMTCPTLGYPVVVKQIQLDNGHSLAGWSSFKHGGSSRQQCYRRLYWCLLAALAWKHYGFRNGCNQQGLQCASPLGQWLLTGYLYVMGLFTMVLSQA